MNAFPAVVDEAAFYGPAGEFVLATDPHSEAHPMALLAQFLVAFGCACGRGAHYRVEADEHYPNEFVVLVGPSAIGRKGTALGHVRRVLSHADPEFESSCLAGGLSSGEGLISQVRDQLDEHAADKRCLVVEQEYAQVLKVLSREGNTLSPIVRQAWDGDTLQTMVRNNPLRAREAHIGVIGHITKDELLRYLTATELANGFFNRFLLIAVTRSKLLPFGGALAEDEVVRIRDAVRTALRFASAQLALAFDDAARERWIDVYPQLSSPRPPRRRRHRARRGARRAALVDLRTARPL